MTRRYASASFEPSNEDKALFPDGGPTKGELIDYYEKIADVMLPHLEDRPLVLERCPDGIEADCFYQKQVGSHFPDWVDREEVELRKGGKQSLTVANDQATLAYLANQGVITMHRWLSTRRDLEKPTLFVVDLDPSSDDFDEVRRAARHARALLCDLGLDPLLMTTGSRGVHLAVALDAQSDFDDVRSFLSDAMEVLAARHPDELTTEARKEKRAGRLYLDIARNAYGQTAVAPYSVRKKPGAPIATPIEWRELAEATPQKWTVDNIFRRLGQRDDPWRDAARRVTSLGEAKKKLAARAG